jgi:hypothetical protein
MQKQYKEWYQNTYLFEELCATTLRSSVTRMFIVIYPNNSLQY